MGGCWSFKKTAGFAIQSHLIAYVVFTDAFPTEDENNVSITCGNGQCDPDEDVTNCPIDCKNERLTMCPIPLPPALSATLIEMHEGEQCDGLLVKYSIFVTLLLSYFIFFV